MDLSSPGTVKSIREKYGLQLSKSLGQNFITDRNILDKIIEGAGVEDGDMVIEIGPGIGSMTQYLCERAGKVTMM